MKKNTEKSGTKQGEKKVDGRLAVLKKHQFKPGQSGNPAGRPKGLRSIQTLFGEAVENLAMLGEAKGKKNFDVEKDIFMKVLDMARLGHPKGLELYFYYRYGKPKFQEGDALNLNIHDETFTDEEKDLIKDAIKNAGLGKVVKA
jgi:hypothetical protein